MRSSQAWGSALVAAIVLLACHDAFAPTATPVAPDVVTAEALGMRLVQLQWSPVPNAMGYRIERRANLEGPFATVTDIASSFVTSFADAGVEPQTTYGYRVLTLSLNGSVSAPSLIAGVRTAPWPSIRVTTSTATPDQTDGDGYTVVIAGSSDTIRSPLTAVDQGVYSPLASGAYRVTLTDVAPNCRVGPDSSVVVTVTDQGLTTLQDVSFIVSCRDPNFGNLRVSVATTGDSVDANGYSLTLTGLADDTALPDSLRAYFQRDSIGVNFSKVYERLRPGTYSLTLEGVAGNCSVAGSASRDFRIEALVDGEQSFAVTCQAADDPNRPLVWRSSWSPTSAAAGQPVALAMGLDLSRRPGQDVAAVQASFTYDAATLRVDSAVQQGPWHATFNTATPGAINWLAFVNGTGPTDSTVFAKFFFTVIGSAGGTVTTGTTIDVATDGGEHDLLPLIRRVEGTFTVAAGGQNLPPVARAGGPYAGTAGQPLTLNGATSSDPDGTIAAYAWTFGDGMTGTGASVSHTYAAAGTYTVTLTVSDNQGATATASATVTVAPSGGGGNQAPVAVINGPYSAVVGAAIAFTSTGSSDPDGSITLYQWTFGDGATATGSAPGHAYAAAGTYTVGLTVTDNQGASASTTTTATISDAAHPFTWGNVFGAESPADSLVTLTITLDLTSDILQTPGPEALQSWAVDSLKWDPSVLRYFAFNFGPGAAGSVNPTDAQSRGVLLFSGTQPAGGTSGVVTIATIKFKVIGASGRSTATRTSLGVLLGTPANGSFSYGPYTTVSEATFVVP